MGMTTTVTLAFEGPRACQDCQRNGIPVCADIGFNDEAWYVAGQQVHVPGLDNAYAHTIKHVEISADRKTVTLTVDTERPAFDNFARHLSFYTHRSAKAAVRTVHHETGEVLEEGFYDRFLTEGMQVAIDRDLFDVRKVEHPNRNENGVAESDVDLQVAHLVPVPAEVISPVNQAGA